MTTAVEAGFLEACARTENHPDADAFCRCAYVETVEFYGSPDAMGDAAPAGPARGLPPEPALVAVFDGCVELHLG